VSREFSVVIEQDEDGYFVASVPALRGCHTQARSLDALMELVREAVQLCIEAEGAEGAENAPAANRFVGVQRVTV
jgi:predicted RNase H-like HicB family nuclease